MEATALLKIIIAALNIKSMKLVIFTICLDAEPYIERHLPVFEKLKIPWEWRIAEGTASNTNCTKWCAPQQPGLSMDGTSEYLNKISSHPNVKVFRRQLWDGKVAMCNACIDDFSAPCVLLQVDSDEFWTTEQLEKIVHKFESNRAAMHAYFFCRYFVGSNIVTVGENCYGNNRGEWLRAWRFNPGMKFISHEPPNLDGNRGAAFSRDETRMAGLVFDHFSWAYEPNVLSKLKFYKYGAHYLSGWKQLQANNDWGFSLNKFLPWVDNRVKAMRIKI
jgi:Glycosyl transferase family 2